MRYSLIEIVQRILESMDSDEVDSISDTVESAAVANIVKECYFEIVGQEDLPENKDIFQLNGSGDSAKPCLMTLPSNVLELYNVKYNSESVGDPSFYDLTFLGFNEFMTHLNGLNKDEDTTVGSQTVTENGQTFTFKFKNDVLPQFYTTFNDRTLLFDAYDSAVNTTLVGSKTLCYGYLEPTFTLEDTFVPDLDPRQHQLLLQAAKAQAFVELKQTENPKAEKKERRNIILSQRTKNAIDRRSDKQSYIGFGRK